MRLEAEHRMQQQRSAKRRGSQRRSVSLYPSPDCSSGGSPEPMLVLSETEEGETNAPPPNAAAGRKRRRSSSSDEDSFIHKRPRHVIYIHILVLALTTYHRNDSITPSEDSSITLPSPPASIEDNLPEVFDYWTSAEDARTDPEPSMTPPPVKRKRRLSDADAQGPRKRPGSLSAAPRLRPVSDPLPRPSAMLPDWSFNNNMLDFEIPDAVTSTPLDPSVPVEVEFFNWANVLSAVNTPDTSTAGELPVAYI